MIRPLEGAYSVRFCLFFSTCNQHRFSAHTYVPNLSHLVFQIFYFLTGSTASFVAPGQYSFVVTLKKNYVCYVVFFCIYAEKVCIIVILKTNFHVKQNMEPN
jgi:hypothetical protein